MIVVKLGGSLYSSPYLKEWVNELTSINSQTVIIVPGGGPFANQVRQAYSDWEINEEIAHEMAVLSMQQYALLISSLNEKISRLDSVNSLPSHNEPNTMVWFPYKDVMEKCNYPKSWQVTSDSLSFWLADAVAANRLCLVKSAEMNLMSCEQLMSSSIVDEYFPVIANNFARDIVFYPANAAQQFVGDVNSGKL